MSPLALLWLVVILAIVGIAGLVMLRSVMHKKSERHYDHDILLITIPRFSDSEKKQPPTAKERLAQIENLFAALSSLKAESGMRAFLSGRSDHFALEIVANKGSISFYASFPKRLSEFFIQQMQSVYPDAHFTRVVDYNIFQPQAVILGGYLVLRRNFIFPIKTYKFFETDPLETLTTALSKIPQGGGAAIQFIVRSAHKSWHREGRAITEAAYKGASLEQALKHQSGASSKSGIAKKLLRGATSIVGASLSASPRKKDEAHVAAPPHTLSPKDLEVIKGIEEKTGKGGFDVNIRIVVSAPDQQQAEIFLRNIMTSFGQYNIYEYGNAFKPLYVGSQKAMIQQFIYRYFDPRARLVLNAEEMAGLFHLPERIKTPNIQWLAAREAPPPVELPEEGILLGHAVYRNHAREVRIRDADRRRHVYIIGQTGTGKSKLLEFMAVQDIQRGKGVCVIDPHGDLIESILANVPKERIDDVIIFDPADTERPLALNMLEYSSPDQKTFLINEMINIFDKLYDLRQTGGPMFEQYMRNAMLLILDDPASGSTLLEISKVLADEKFRKHKLSKTQNIVVKDFWEKEAQKAGGEAALANMVPYITSKLTQFVANDIMRPIIAQQTSSFNFRTVMDEQKILLINLSKGKIGEMNSALLGMICVGKLLMAALSRVDSDAEKRRDFYLYIDEFQNFVTESIAIILSEARKYKLNLTIAHQYITQLVKNNDTRVRDAVFGNVGTSIAFRIGVEDAEKIAQQFAPVFDQYDVMNMERYHFYIRLLIDNQNPPAFSCKALLPPAGITALARRLKEVSRLKYGRPRAVIEQEILERTKIGIPIHNPLPPIA